MVLTQNQTNQTVPWTSLSHRNQNLDFEFQEFFIPIFWPEDISVTGRQVAWLIQFDQVTLPYRQSSEPPNIVVDYFQKIKNAGATLGSGGHDDGEGGAGAE